MPESGFTQLTSNEIQTINVYLETRDYRTRMPHGMPTMKEFWDGLATVSPDAATLPKTSLMKWLDPGGNGGNCFVDDAQGCRGENTPGFGYPPDEIQDDRCGDEHSGRVCSISGSEGNSYGKCANGTRPGGGMNRCPVDPGTGIPRYDRVDSASAPGGAYCRPCGLNEERACGATSANGWNGSTCYGAGTSLYAVGGVNYCYVCNSDAGCSGGTPRCDTSKHVCKQCTTNAHCASGYVCSGGSCLPMDDYFEGCPDNGTQWSHGVGTACLEAPTLYPYQTIEGQFTDGGSQFKYRIRADIDNGVGLNWKHEVSVETADVTTSDISLRATLASGVPITMADQYAVATGNSDAFNAPFDDPRFPSHGVDHQTIAWRTVAPAGGVYHYITVSNGNGGEGNNGWFKVKTSAPATSWLFATAGHMPYYGRAVGETSTDADWYAVRADAIGRVSIQVDAVYSQGDIDFSLHSCALFQGCSTLAANTFTGNNRETLFKSGLSPNGYYYVKLYGYNGAKNNYIITLGDPNRYTFGVPDPIDNTY
jgi:hypothetical protein